MIIPVFTTTNGAPWNDDHTELLRESVMRLSDVWVELYYPAFDRPNRQVAARIVNLAFTNEEEYLKFTLMTSDRITPSNIYGVLREGHKWFENHVANLNFYIF